MEDTSKNKEIVDNPFPVVRFVLDEGLNADILNRFLGRKGINRGGANFSELIRKVHPALAGLEDLKPDERLVKVKEYIHGYYEEHKEGLEKATQDIDIAWRQYAPQFFGEVRKTFPKTEWPEGKYVGHLSVSPPCPRFLESKTFMVMYKTINRAIRISAHEMLHFIFFEYVRERYLPDMQNTVQKEMEQRLEGKFKVPLWDLSEIFNLMVLSGKEWGMASVAPSESSYTDLVKQLPEFQKIWDESNHNIDEFFSRVEVGTDKRD